MAGAIAKYHCNYCEEDIINIRVKCSECTDFDLCLQCFSCGAEIGVHRNKHAYQLIDCGTFPIFSSTESNWKAIEEVALLEAIEQYGFGNWSDIAESIGIKGLDGQQVKDHYLNYFVTGNIGKCTWSCIDSKAFSNVKDHTCPNDCPLSPSLTTPLPAITEVSQTEQQTLGYMPKRDDFEREYDNDAESLVSTLTISANDDDELETAFKIAHINMYQRRLMERFRKKHIAREYGLVNAFFRRQLSQREHTNNTNIKNSSANCGKKKSSSSSLSSLSSSSLTLSSEENACPLSEKLRQFCRFDQWEERQELNQNLQKERELKTRIKELIRYRRNGLKRLSECSAFETARCKREKRKENKKKSISNANTSSAHKRPLGSTGRGSATEKDLTNTTPSHTARKGSAITGEPLGLDKGQRNEAKEDFDIASLPGCRLLSEREKKLCASVRLRPTQYVTLKTLILKDHSQKRKGSSQTKSSLENIDKSLRRKIVNFMVKSGWISAS